MRTPLNPIRPPLRVLLLHVAVILGVGLVAYAGSFDGEFVSDDISAIRDNPKLRSLDREHLTEIVTTFDDANYIPVKVLSLAIDYQLWGSDPAGYHMTNLLIHLGCAVLIYFTLLRMGLGAVAALLTSLLWAVHPLQVESVAWISERKNTLSGLFFFAAFYLYLGFSERRRVGTYLAILLLYVLALLTKMNTMVLPVIFLVYEAAYRFRLRRNDVLASLPLFAIAAVVAWYNLAGNPIHGASWHGGSMVTTWLTSAVVFFGYLGKVIAPVGLQTYYAVRLHDSPADLAVLAALLGLVALAVVTIRLLRESRRAAFWILWFGITLLPMLNVVVPFRVLMQDRYMYLALLGPLAFAAEILTASARSATAKRVLAGAACVAVVVCVALTVNQVEVWANPLSIWKNGAVARPQIPGSPGTSVPDLEAKVEFLDAEVRRDPSSALLQHNLGALLFAAGRPDKALPLMETAVRLDPDDGIAQLDLGRTYAALGRHEQALPPLERAVELEPHLGPARHHLALTYIRLRDPGAARRELEVYARLQPASGHLARDLALLEQLEASLDP
jgi:hypothetical protein